jgi:hypothetical protein
MTASAVRTYKSLAPQLKGDGNGVAGRFRVEELIGRGGMADVYRVLDASSGGVLALKRLRPVEDPGKRQRSLELFEREFHTLCQLAHPRIVRVHDYGIEQGDPYYTMELLDGGDLQERAPLQWQQACAIARDVCSALSLLHSRKLVYRDMSPRNVRLTSDGQAKVIDFGAMLPIGPAKQVVGTAAFCPPEAVRMQALDARTDLYSLGATLYFMLTGRRAYPARDFKQLRELWRQTPRLPSQLTPGIPAALDALVMDLMQLEPERRPASAGEVMDRLSAIAGLSEDEQLMVSQAYLSTPTLVGRERELDRIRKKISAAQSGRGGAIIISGPAGVGRSRLVESSGLEAKLAGTTVLRADAIDAQSGDYGALRALARQLIEVVPEAALEAARALLPILGHALPELLDDEPSVSLAAFEDRDQQRAALQPALRKWFLDVARSQPLLIAIDDVDRIDEPSAAFVALLAYEAPPNPLLVITTCEGDTLDSPSLKLLSQASVRLTLSNLSAEHGAMLLRSVFGEVPHVDLLAHRLHALASGNPRDLLRLAEHLVHKQVVRYQAGAWSLPAQIDASELPESIAHERQGRVDALSQDARELAQAMSLCPEQRFSFDECLLLTAHREARLLLPTLDQLASNEIVRAAFERYGITHQSWLTSLQSTLDQEREQRLHLRLVELFQRRGQGFSVAKHLLEAGEEDRGVDTLVEVAKQSHRENDQNKDGYSKLLQSLPTGWFEMFERAIALCAKLDKPKRFASILRARQTSLMSSATGVTVVQPFLEALRQLELDSGLDDWKKLDPNMAPGERLGAALTAAATRYNAASPHERVCDPRIAIGQLARTVTSASAIIAVSLDQELMQALPSLKILESLSPALGSTDLLLRGIAARMTARAELACEFYQQLGDRLAQPDRGGFGASYHNHANLGAMCGLGLIQAGMGLDSTLAWAKAIEANPMYQVNAGLIRMVYHLWQGQVRDAEQCRQRVELLRIQNGSNQWLEGVHLMGEITAHAAALDLVRVKQTLEPIESMAKRYRGWIPVLHYARGEYQRIRGNPEGALLELEAGLSLVQPGNHQLWANLAGCAVQTLVELGRYEEAVSRGRDYLQAGAAQQLGYVLHFIRMPLALATMHRGDLQGAVECSQQVVDSLQAISCKGLLLGLAHETRARVASHVRDAGMFEHHAALCAEQYKRSENRALSARYERLMAEAQGADIGVRSDVAEAVEFTDTGTGTHGSQISEFMEGCHGPNERALRSLRLLLKASGTREGFLFTLAEGSAVLSAQVAERELPPQVSGLARDFLTRETTHAMTQTMTATLEATPEEAAPAPSTDWTSEWGQAYRPVLLSHQSDQGYTVVGLAVLAVDPTKPFAYPEQLAQDLSRFAYDSGDVSGFIANSRWQTEHAQAPAD